MTMITLDNILPDLKIPSSEIKIMYTSHSIKLDGIKRIYYCEFSSIS